MYKGNHVNIKHLVKPLVLVFLILSFSSVSLANSGEEVGDPWEGFNRAMFSFNDGLDRYVLLPVTKGYRFVMPDMVEKGVNNFFENLGDVSTFINNSLQGKIGYAAQDLARVAFNSTFGLLGFIDVASGMGIEKHDEDFGQTLGYWGVESGPYLVLPLLGPSNVRDGISLIPDYYMDPITYLDEDNAAWWLLGIRAVDTRSQLLKQEKLISGDRYSFIRDAYLQRREFLVNDGEIGDNFDEDNF
ncbi:MAG: VacJ family lipoprotein [Motiliproteus sp.]|nr:VacJ family lipoprotein [Motiliproteus sp.]MCW9051960.1 VacJ family lipoprotein [Motiliproteus sp.]